METSRIEMKTSRNTTDTTGPPYWTHPFQNPTNPDYGVNCKISLLVFETKPGIFCLCCKTNSYAIEY